MHTYTRKTFKKKEENHNPPPPPPQPIQKDPSTRQLILSFIFFKYFACYSCTFLKYILFFILSGSYFCLYYYNAKLFRKKISLKSTGFTANQTKNNT